jgi:hypothetical protein
MKRYAVSVVGLVINGACFGGIYERSWPWALFFLFLASVNGYVLISRASEGVPNE